MLYSYRPHTKDFRFSCLTLRDAVGSDMDLKDFGPLLTELGARRVGQARVTLEDGSEVIKDNVFSVENMDTFLSELSSFLEWMNGRSLVRVAVLAWRNPTVA